MKKNYKKKCRECGKDFTSSARNKIYCDGCAKSRKDDSDFVTSPKRQLRYKTKQRSNSGVVTKKDYNNLTNVGNILDDKSFMKYYNSIKILEESLNNKEINLKEFNELMKDYLRKFPQLSDKKFFVDNEAQLVKYGECIKEPEIDYTENPNEFFDDVEKEDEKITEEEKVKYNRKLRYKNFEY